MPHYVFRCEDCKKEFTLVLHIADMEQGGQKCPHCGSAKVEQQLASFSAMTSKKS